MSISTGLLAIAALLAANAFFVAAEFSLVAVDRARMEAAAADGDAGARRVVALLRRLTVHLSGAQFGITLSALMLGFVAEPTVARILTGETHPPGPSVLVAILLASTSTILSSPTSSSDITSLLYDTDTDVVGEEEGQEEDEGDGHPAHHRPRPHHSGWR